MTIGKLLLTAGVVLVLLGLALSLAPGLLGWFGHLPGDIRIERENGSFYFPVTSILLNLFFRR